MQVTVFGPTKVMAPDGVVAAGEFGGVKPRQILEILAISAGTPVSKELIAELLWGGQPPRSYLGTLESYVCVLRRALGLAGARGAGVVTVRQGYLLDPEVLQVDLATFRSLVRTGQADHDPRACLTQLEQALTLVNGELLADEAYAGWAVAERASLQRELVAIESLAASCALELGEPDVALRHAQAALARDRLAEGAWRTLMEAMAASGRRSEALRAYFELRDHLADELGSDPSRETSDLYLDLLRGETPTGASVSAVDEVRMLMGLLRDAMLAVPEFEIPRADRGWLKRASDMVPEMAPKMAPEMALS